MSQIKTIKDKYPALDVYRSSWTGFFAVGFFSFFVNLGALASPVYMQQIFDRVMQSRHIETLIFLTVLVIFFLAVIAVLDGVRGSMLAKIAYWWDETVHSDLLVAIVEVARAKGISHAQSINDLMTVRQFVGGPSVLPIFDGPWMPIFIFAIALIHPWLGIVAVVAAALLFICAGINDRVTRRRMNGLGERQNRAQSTADIATRHADSVYSMGMLDGIVQRFKDDNGFVAQAMYRVSAFSAKISALSKFIRFSAQISVLGLGAYLATVGEMTSGGMIAASIILGRALAPAEQSMGAWRSLVAAVLAHRRIKQVFLNAPGEQEKLKQPAARGYVELRGVSFIMPGMECPILRGIDIAFPAKSIIAIVGASGSGKSTLCKMLIGALEPTAGSVRLDGVSIRNWDREQFGESIGYLAQSVQLLDATIKDNIARMGEVDEFEVVEAAQLAGCHDMINQLPKGYETLIGPSGVNLSGGQAQRIGFARAVYRQPKLVVLDEPNSNLDAEGDMAFQKGISDLRERGSTVIIVSHKPAALSKVDLIVTVKDGGIEKTQTREDFLKSAIRPLNDVLEKLNDAKQKRANRI
ncbi:type I secretion system permease/ATPase [Hoeflea sp. TYP-13]|uniref:type I secretion system permease/ATPase n=1 Tax=Hoeflea sp. TYP-13 TaxID=3230023 RepID=UPI0034C5DE76